MADKILRPITDVEIVEQMTENDTVLIEQNGVIKRTKGVVGGGGGKKYTLLVEAGDDGMNFSIDVGFEELKEMIMAGEMPDICIAAKNNGIVASVSIVYFLSIPNESEIVLGSASGSDLIYFSDGTIEVD